MEIIASMDIFIDITATVIITTMDITMNISAIAIITITLITVIIIMGVIDDACFEVRTNRIGREAVPCVAGIREKGENVNLMPGQAVDCIFDIMTKKLKKKGGVTLVGFGAVKVGKSEGRKDRNPRPENARCQAKNAKRRSPDD